MSSPESLAALATYILQGDAQACPETRVTPSSSYRLPYLVRLPASANEFYLGFLPIDAHGSSPTATGTVEQATRAELAIQVQDKQAPLSGGAGQRNPPNFRPTTIIT